MILDFFSEKVRTDEIPSDMRAEAKDRRQELIESLSNVDETLGEMFLEEKTPSNDEIRVRLEFIFIPFQTVSLTL